jgi:hypothetical protein
VRDMLKISHFSAEFQRADLVAENPAVWFIQVDGLIVDARSVPRDLQVEAYLRGLIPYARYSGPRRARPSAPVSWASRSRGRYCSRFTTGMLGEPVE